MRIRTIKPEFPLSESVGRLTREARLLFILLWTVCDDAGRTRAASRVLASLLYPFDDDAPALIEGWLGELEREGMVRRYCFDGNHYLEVCNWLRHQKIDRPSASRLPSPQRALASPREPSMLDHGPRTMDLPPPPQGGAAGEEAPSPTSTEQLRDAETVWAVWPKRIDTLASLSAITNAIRRDGIERVLEGTKAIVRADSMRKASPPGRYLPKPVEFFDGSRYLDDPAQYAPRAASLDSNDLRRVIQELERQVAEHPGNPANAEGSFDRKSGAEAEYKALKAELVERRAALGRTLTEETATEVGR